jgi:hypothetical protein
MRAPDGELRDPQGDSSRLLELVNPGAALLLFEDVRMPHWNRETIEPYFDGVQGLSVFRILESSQLANPGDYRDATGSLWKAWRIGGQTAVLVRPDGIVGWIPHDLPLKLLEMVSCRRLD